MPSFVDTNVLVYAEDRDAGAKRDRASALVLELWDTRNGVISVQVLQELFVTITRKLPKRMPSKKAYEIIREYRAWRVVDSTADLLDDAIGLQLRARLSLWDALIVQAALSAGCDRLYSDALDPGQSFGPVEIVNPFV